ncbi:hypothetical protein ACWIGI_28830 [Nocardia sp. NPDC055321]
MKLSHLFLLPDTGWTKFYLPTGSRIIAIEQSGSLPDSVTVIAETKDDPTPTAEGWFVVDEYLASFAGWPGFEEDLPAARFIPYFDSADGVWVCRVGRTLIKFYTEGVQPVPLNNAYTPTV